MAIANVTLSNTFAQWIITTNQTVTDLNNLQSGTYIKSAGSIIINGSGGFTCGTPAPASFANTVTITGVGSTLLVSNYSTFSNTINIITGTTSINASGKILTDSLNVANTTTTNQLIVTNNTNTTLLTSNTININGQLTSNSIGTSNTGTGQIYLNGTTSNRIEFNNIGLGAPSLVSATRTVGTKILLYNQFATGTDSDYAIGMLTNQLWASVARPTSTYTFAWYAGDTQIATLNGLGVFNVSGGVTTPAQYISTYPGSLTQGAGQVYLNGATNNRIDFNINGTNIPTIATKSIGQKITLFPGFAGTTTDAAIGIGNDSSLWQVVPSTSWKYTWYASSNTIATLTGNGDFSANTVITTGNIGLGNTTPATIGTGITFPATFNNSTNVNTLDDYEEGTWTPTLASGFTTTGTVVSTGNYTKIGNVINCWYTISATTIITASLATVTGLPFTTTAIAHGISGNSGGQYFSAILASGTTITYNQSMPSVATISATIVYRS
jgi:TM2 domain-containing membrane protein YozV